MILEIANFYVLPARQDEFEVALRQGIATALSQSPGFIRASVQRSIEAPGHYVLLVEWDTLEDHMEGFRNGPLFPVWRALIGEFFASPPNMAHYVDVL